MKIHSNDWEMTLNNAHDPSAEYILIPIIHYEIALFLVCAGQSWVCANSRFARNIHVVSIPACHAGDRGSIPRHGVFLNFFYTDG